MNGKRAIILFAFAVVSFTLVTGAVTLPQIGSNQNQVEQVERTEQVEQGEKFDYMESVKQSRRRGIAKSSIIPTAVVACQVSDFNCRSNTVQALGSASSLAGDATDAGVDLLDGLLDWDDKAERRQTQETFAKDELIVDATGQEAEQKRTIDEFRADNENFQSRAEAEADEAVYEAEANNKSKSDAVLAGRQAINDTADVDAQFITQAKNDLTQTPAYDKRTLDKFGIDYGVMATTNSSGEFRKYDVDSVADMKNVSSLDNTIINVTSNIQNSTEVIDFYAGDDPNNLIIDLNGYNLNVSRINYEVAGGYETTERNGSVVMTSGEYFGALRTEGYVTASFLDMYSSTSTSTGSDIELETVNRMHNDGFGAGYDSGRMKYYDPHGVVVSETSDANTDDPSTSNSAPIKSSNDPVRRGLYRVTFNPDNTVGTVPTVQLGDENFTAVEKQVAGNTYKWMTAYTVGYDGVNVNIESKPLSDAEIVYNIPKNANYDDESAVYVNNTAWNELWTALQTQLQTALTQAGTAQTGYLADIYTDLSNSENTPRVGQFNYNLTPQDLNKSPKISAMIQYYPNYEGPIEPTKHEIEVTNNGTSVTGDLYVLNASKVGVTNKTWTNNTSYDFGNSRSILATSEQIIELDGTSKITNITYNKISQEEIENRDGYAEYDVQSLDEEWGAYQDANEEVNKQIEQSSTDGGGGTIGGDNITDSINSVFNNVLLLVGLLTVFVGIVLLLYLTFIVS